MLIGAHISAAGGVQNAPQNARDKGKIGLEGFKTLLPEKRLKNINLILETPAGEERLDDMRVLKKIRGK